MYSFRVYGKVIQLYTHTCVYMYILFQILFYYYKILNIVFCAIQ